MDNRESTRGDPDNSACPGNHLIMCILRWQVHHPIHLVIIINRLAVYTKKSRQDSAQKPNVCLTPACVHASSEILYNLSPDYKDLDACTDFEELVCSGWNARHDMRPDQASTGTMTTMSENGQMLLRHMLESPYPDGSEVRTILGFLTRVLMRHIALSLFSCTIDHYCGIC